MAAIPAWPTPQTLGAIQWPLCCVSLERMVGQGPSCAFGQDQCAIRLWGCGRMRKRRKTSGHLGAVQAAVAIGMCMSIPCRVHVESKSSLSRVQVESRSSPSRVQVEFRSSTSRVHEMGSRLGRGWVEFGSSSTHAQMVWSSPNRVQVVLKWVQAETKTQVESN